jgi:5-methylcytosine-specific restriction endonuclease McrA
MSYAQTLILSQAYRPHEIVDWKTAVTRMFNGKLEVLAQYDEILTVIGRNHLITFPELQKALRQVIGVDAESITIKVPAVAVLCRKISHVKSGVKFSKINVCLRDNFKCQYCGKQLPMSQLTYDHVVPKSKGGKKVWDNIVMACSVCNPKKADKTCKEAGMRPFRMPKRPVILPMSQPYIDALNAPVEWSPYITAA